MEEEIVGCADLAGMLYKECDKCEWQGAFSKCHLFRVIREYHVLRRKK